MKYTLATYIMVCLIFSCRDNDEYRIKTDDEISSKMKKGIDSFVNDLAAFSITRIKKVAKRIDQIGPTEELALDTLPDESILAYNKINGNLEFYLKTGQSIIQLHSEQLKESIRADAIAIELFDAMKRRKCEHWTKICKNTEFPLSHEDKLLCELNINFYCK